MKKSVNMNKKKQQSIYEVGNKVRFRTREISFLISRMAGTLISLCLEDYPEQEAIGTIYQVYEIGNFGYRYAIRSEHGFRCTIVRPADIIEIITEDQA